MLEKIKTITAIWFFGDKIDLFFEKIFVRRTKKTKRKEKENKNKIKENKRKKETTQGYDIISFFYKCKYASANVVKHFAMLEKNPVASFFAD